MWTDDTNSYVENSLSSTKLLFEKQIQQVYKLQIEIKNAKMLNSKSAK